MGAGGGEGDAMTRGGRRPEKGAREQTRAPSKLSQGGVYFFA